MEEPVLFLNACVRKRSRTLRLAGKLLQLLARPYEEVRVSEIEYPKIDEAYLEKRDALVRAGAPDDEFFALARQFAEAETIVIAAPYWDLSFPAALKRYLETVNVVGITFRYSEAGVPIGLCRAKTIYYVTTAGGNFAPDEFGFGYVKALAEGYYGIHNVILVKATGLDLVGADAEEILKNQEKSLANSVVDS